MASTVMASWLNEVSTKSRVAIERQGGTIEEERGSYHVHFPEGTERLGTSSISGWRENESKVSQWRLPDGTVLEYSTDIDDKKLIVRSRP